MLIIKERADIALDYDISKLCDPAKVIYFDIETTGFSRKYNTVYLIGCMYHEDGELYSTQYFAENPKEEAIILQEFYKKLVNYSTIIHFNGASFDMPFIKERGEKFNIEFDFCKYDSIDLYKNIKPFSHMLKLENLKQKTVEKLCNINREDPFTGGELIEVYKEYVLKRDERLLKALLMHNMEDVFYMGKLTSILSFTDMMEGYFIVDSFETSTFNDVEGNEQKELRIQLKINNPLPFNLSYRKNNIYISGKGDTIHLTSRIEFTDLKYFFANYKDYYFLPEEDMAMHKSVAGFVDKNHRKNATPATCYIKKCGLFLSIGTSDTTEFGELFKKEYKDKEVYINVDKINPDNIDIYARLILKNL